MKRTIDNWREIIATKTSADELAQFILDDLTHYRNGRSCESSDRQNLANALLAHAQFQHLMPVERNRK